jgi:hypothetical protein
LCIARCRPLLLLSVVVEAAVSGVAMLLLMPTFAGVSVDVVLLDAVWSPSFVP